MKTNIVTKEWLASKLANEAERERVIGRALLAIYNNQTFNEQHSAATVVKNGIGFAKPDARVGSIGARQFKSKAHLEQWVIDIWMRLAKDGNPRICKYADQLNQIAVERHRLATTRYTHENARA